MKNLGVVRALATVVVIGVGVLGPNGAARADSFAYGCAYSPHEPCRQDNGGIVWCQAASLNGFPDLKDATTWAMNALAGSTDLTASMASGCSSSTDIQFKRADIGDYTLGASRCTSYDAQSQRCMAAEVITDVGTQLWAMDDPNGEVPFSNGTESPGELVRNFRANWCHEAGHTVGLDHHPPAVADRDWYYDDSTADREQDCMVSGHLEFDQQWMRVNPHHRGHINAAY